MNARAGRDTHDSPRRSRGSSRLPTPRRHGDAHRPAPIVAPGSLPRIEQARVLASRARRLTPRLRSCRRRAAAAPPAAVARWGWTAFGSPSRGDGISFRVRGWTDDSEPYDWISAAGNRRTRWRSIGLRQVKDQFPDPFTSLRPCSVASATAPVARRRRRHGGNELAARWVAAAGR